jgi:hypothetical protein
VVKLEYAEFIRRKSQAGRAHGFDPLWIPSFLKDFQKSLVEWSVMKGRAAVFAGTGMGKTVIQLVWAENIVRKTDSNTLILAPLAVAPQTVREAAKFGIEAMVSRDGVIRSRITVTNYEQIHKFNPADFTAVVGDEMACIKAFDGKRRKEVTRFMSKIPYRLACTATPAPNDYIELGTIAEAIGEMPQSEMLSIFFHASDNKRHSLFREGDFWNRDKWFFRPHAQTPFWRWVCSWARACRKPSDLGDFDDAPYVLPRLIVNQHIIKTDWRAPGELFARVARTLKEQRLERRRTMAERCEKVASLVRHGGQFIAWCQYNEEGDRLADLIKDAVQVAGCDSDEVKEERLEAFALGKVPGLITKPKIASWGLNYQNCGHQAFFPSHSFEQYFQAVRRSWRFGRKDPVNIDIVTTEGEAGVTANLQKKERRAEKMLDSMILEMHNGSRIDHVEDHINQVDLPEWLVAN